MRDVVGWEGYYKVTSCGKVWSVRRERFLKPAGGKGNYQMIMLQSPDRREIDYIHRIVAKAYIPNPENHPEVNHKDEVKDHNWVNNLEWCTKHYNLAYSMKRSGRPSLKVRCVETGEEYKSLHDAAKAKKIDATNLSALLKHGKAHNTLGGYHWEYAN